MSYYTPGPWAVHRHFPTDIVPAGDAVKPVGASIYPDQDARYAQIIASVVAREPFDGCENFTRRLFWGTEAPRANARLIATAPELYEAAVAMLDVHDTAAQKIAGHDCDCEGCTIFRPLVAKAEGR